MGCIRELSQDVIEKIAAGEVVERPASVARELVENAIDAGARSIAIDCADGGRERVAVMDDGAGMDAEDIARCVLRHATSKLGSADELFAIRTMGFRGEALAAIGAVSRLSIESRENRPAVIEGARIEVEGGVVRGPVAHGCAGGTKVVAADLFFNVPARLKFLKSAAVEFGHLHDAVTQLALAHPTIRFELTADGRRRFLSPADDLEGRVALVLGDPIRARLVRVAEEGAGIALEGWVAEGGRAGGKDLHVFVNCRPVRDRILTHAVAAAFGERLSRGQYPAAVLWLSIDPAAVDVNVHPAKREVRFARGGAVHDFVASACRKALAMTVPAHAVQAHLNANTDSSLRLAASGAGGSPAILRRGPKATESGEFRRRSESVFAFSLPDLDAAQTTLRVIGQLGSTYVVCEDADGTLVLIDQHAAHERLGFDELRRSFARGSVPQQLLVVPERVELGPRAQGYVLEHLEPLRQAGFDVEPFGGSSLLVKVVPAIMGGASVAAAFARLADELEELGSSPAMEEAVDRIFAVVACHRQVRAGDQLSHQELATLVRDIERQGVTHCPHGRPALVRIDKAEIEKRFKRSS